MAERLDDLLTEQAHAGLVGREQELQALVPLLTNDAPVIGHVFGVAGIGKSRLLSAFAARARAGGATVIQLDCREIEPSVSGFLSDLAAAVGAASADLETVAERLAGFDGRVVLALDTYELLRLLDAWLRREFVPSLRDNARLLLVGRERPISAWITAPGWAELTVEFELQPLRETDALALLERLGMPAKAARDINGVVRGHALALTVAAMLSKAEPGRLPKDVAVSALVDELSSTYLESTGDSMTRRVLLAASVVRRVTEPLLAALVPEIAPRDAFERLRALPFVESVSDGLVIHDAVREALETSLRLSDPELHRDLRRVAWHYLRRQMREGTRGNLWRETADLLYLLRNAGVREGFFPTGTNTVPIEPADPADHSAIRSIVERHEGPEATVALLTWLEDKPEYFSVARDREGGVAGFSIFMPATELSERIISRDPVAAAMHRDLGDLESPDLAYIYRRILDAEEGEAPSETSAAASLDGKRTYMEVRPAIRYVYFAVRDYEAYEPIMEPLGFEPVLAPPVVDGTQHQLVMLDMGPQSVDGWLGRVVAAELGIDDGASGTLDRQARTLRSPTGPVHLTPLEFGVMTELSDRVGEAVTRVELTEAVWGYSADSSSNVVEVVVGSLRKKLGEQADLVETVRGVGYRLREQ